tara:strand:+ start:632 stop:880 length:249 start_codon:yes stop_codon:yes gene_type:complete
MASKVKCKIFLKDGSDNDFVVGSKLKFDGKTFAENSQNFPDYQSARVRYDDLTLSFPHCDGHDEIEEDLEKAINDSNKKDAL